MKYPDTLNGDVFRRLEQHHFDFTKEYTVDFHAVFATEEEADIIAKMYLSDLRAGHKISNIETKPHEAGGMCLDLAVDMIVSYASITDFEDKLANRVATVEGYLDGWGVLQEPNKIDKS